MKEKIYQTPQGSIHYWISEPKIERACTLLFLPGLTADHRLFNPQTEFFQSRVNVFVWDAPGHAASWPFALNFCLMEEAKWLYEILLREGMEKPVLIGQSMGGYVAQAFMELFPGVLSGFISIDSAPLQRRYVTAGEIWLLKRMEPVYRSYPWKWLLRSGVKGCAVTEYGRKLMGDMMAVYAGDQARYAKLAGHGFRMLAHAMEANLPYSIDCPCLLLCGDRDQAGSTKRYNRAWSQTAGLRLEWIENAGHNSNTDRPEKVNALIEDFLSRYALQEPNRA